MRILIAIALWTTNSDNVHQQQQQQRLIINEQQQFDYHSEQQKQFEQRMQVHPFNGDWRNPVR